MYGSAVTTKLTAPLAVLAVLAVLALACQPASDLPTHTPYPTYTEGVSISTKTADENWVIWDQAGTVTRCFRELYT